MFIDKSLYGIKTSADRWHKALANVLRKLGFIPSKADSDLWIKYCSIHYEYLVIYVDDSIIVSNRTPELVKELNSLEGYTLKEVGKPV